MRAPRLVRCERDAPQAGGGVGRSGVGTPAQPTQATLTFDNGVSLSQLCDIRYDSVGWLYQCASTCVAKGGNSDSCPGAGATTSLWCAGGSSFGYGLNQAQGVASALANGGEFPADRVRAFIDGRDVLDLWRALAWLCHPSCAECLGCQAFKLEIGFSSVEFRKWR